MLGTRWCSKYHLQTIAEILSGILERQRITVSLSFFLKKGSFLCRCQTREEQDDGRVALTHTRANLTRSWHPSEGRAWALGTHFSPATCPQSTERFPAQPLTGPSPQWGSPVFQVTLGPLSSTPDLGARGRDAVTTETRSVASRWGRVALPSKLTAGDASTVQSVFCWVFRAFSCGCHSNFLQKVAVLETVQLTNLGKKRILRSW